MGYSIYPLSRVIFRMEESEEINMKRIIPLLAVLLILIVNPASASIFGDIWHSFAPQQQQSTNYLVPQPDNFTSLYHELQTFNTPQNINLVSGYMQSYGVNVIQVHVIDYNSDFYVARGSGITLQPPSKIDTTVKLTVPQIRQIEGYIANGELSWWDQWQLWMMYKHRN
jgi:hypothetical protein